MSLTDKFHETLAGFEEDPKVRGEVADMVLNAPDSSERDGLLAMLYHEGIGVPRNLDKAFELAEKAAFEGSDGLAYFLLGYMCDNAETPDQAEGGPRQKYDHYDAERFYEICSGIESRWRESAVIWLGDYYMNMAQGGDPEIGVEYYESIADDNAEAAGKLSDYYWNLIMPEYLEDEEWRRKAYEWTSVACRLNPEDYSYRMGWIYADGIGCERNFDKAKEYFGKAYGYGDWRGAEAIAKLYEERLEEKGAANEAEEERIRKEISEWHQKGDEMYEESLTKGEEALDNCEEED